MKLELRSDKKMIEVEYAFLTGDKNNSLPFGRKFVHIRILENDILVENGWDLLPTVNNKDITCRWALDGYELMFSSVYSTAICMRKSKRHMVINRKYEGYQVCCLWNVEDNEVEFRYNENDEYNMRVMLTASSKQE